MSTRDSHSQSPSHAIVIGAGFGGLAAALRLAVRGWRVTVLERNDQPGGRARVFRDKGYVFDAGPTVITAPFLFEELWQMCGRKLSDDVDMRAVDPFYKVRFNDGDSFHYNGDPDNMRREVARVSPSDVEGYERFVKMSKEIFDVGFERLAHVPFSRWQDMAKIVPQMMALKSYRTVYGLVASYVKSEKLRQVLSFHPLLVGGNPFNTTSIYSLIPHLERKWGVHFPIGGTGALVQGMVKLLGEQGGTLRLNSTVEEILVENGRTVGVRLAGGEVLKSDIVVSNADAAWTYRRLIKPEHRTRWTDEKLASARYSMSLFVWYFGTDRKYDNVDHHTILLGPRYRELLDDIFEKKHLAEDFSLYLHRPTATDPALAPPGGDTFYVLSPVPHQDSGIDWTERMPRYRDAIQKVLTETMMPGLREHIVTERMLTPMHFREELLSEKGAAFSLEPSLTQSAYFRPHNESEDVDGLYLVGAGTHPGAGVPGVLSSARVLDAVVPAPAVPRSDTAPPASQGAARAA